MNRRVLRLSAMIGTLAVSTLAVAPVFAAAPVSSATAQSINLAIAGNNVVSQITTATNDGTKDSSTVPPLVDALPGTNLIGAGVLPQEAVAKKDGTSYACAGVAGTGGGIVTVGNSGCNLNGSPLTINLAKLDLGNALLGNQGALSAALNQLPLVSNLLALLGPTLNQVVGQISTAINGTPLGQIGIGGSLSAIEASCAANPEAATGDARLVDSSGGSAVTPITLDLPGGVKLPLLDLPANPPPNTKLLTNLNVVTQALIDGLKQELKTALGGALATLNLGTLLQSVQDVVIDQLVTALQPLLQPLEQYLADVTLNKQVKSDGGKKIEVTAIDAQVLPAAKAIIGSSVISGEIGKVSCGPNTKATPPTTPPTTTPETPVTPEVPTVVDSGLAGHSDNTARTVLAATAALMMLAGAAGLIGYRRMLSK